MESRNKSGLDYMSARRLSPIGQLGQ